MDNFTFDDVKKIVQAARDFNQTNGGLRLENSPQDMRQFKEDMLNSLLEGFKESAGGEDKFFEIMEASPSYKDIFAGFKSQAENVVTQAVDMVAASPGASADTLARLIYNEQPSLSVDSLERISPQMPNATLLKSLCSMVEILRVVKERARASYEPLPLDIEEKMEHAFFQEVSQLGVSLSLETKDKALDEFYAVLDKALETNDDVDIQALAPTLLALPSNPSSIHASHKSVKSKI